MTDITERLRSSAKAFREHTVYDSEGDPCHLGVQADEMDEAADAIEQLHASLKAVYQFAEKTANGITWRFHMQPCAVEAREILAKTGGEAWPPQTSPMPTRLW